MSKKYFSIIIVFFAMFFFASKIYGSTFIGDINNDNQVNLNDYSYLVQNFGFTNCQNLADLNSDCKVNLFDFNILIRNFGIQNQTSIPSGSFWTPVIGQEWQWQLSTPVDQSVNVPVFDIDGFDNSASVVSALHSKGAKVICYLSVGTSEDFRSDYSSFPSVVKGNGNNWAGENWLDIRRWDILGPIMINRINMCKDKGFDAVEPDNIDGYSNNTGFQLTANDQLVFNKRIADYAHSIGLSVGLKNDIDQIPELEPYFDWALNEQCFQYNECEPYSEFINNGKAVLNVEYNLNTNQFCNQAKQYGFSSMKKGINLDAPRTPCL